MDVTGTLKVIGETQQIKDTFKKRDFVLTLEGEYPQHVQFECTQDKCSLLDNIKTGQSAKVFFNLKGREYTDKEGKVKYFNSLQAWKIEVLAGGSQATSSGTATEPSGIDPLPF